MKALKKLLTLLCVGTLAVVMCMLAACDGKPGPDPDPDPDPQPTEVTITLDKTTMTLDEGASGAITATVTGSDAAVTATSSNTAVATVAVAGKTVTVSALTAGTTDVTVKVGDKSAKCAVTVNAVVHLPSFAISADYVVLEDDYADNDDTVDITVMEIDVTYTGEETVTCAIEDEEVATAEYADGKVTITAVGTGKTTLTVSAGEDDLTCTVEVATFGLVYGNVLDGDNSVMEVSDSDRRTSTDVYIPGYYWFEDDEAYYPVTQIKSGTANGAAFNEDGGFTGSNIVTIYTGDNVNYIGGKAFKGSTELKEVHCGPSLRTIDGYAFEACSALDTINWGESQVSNIGRVAFQECAFTEITIPESVIGIGDCAFRFCASLTKVRILSENVTKLWGKTFMQSSDANDMVLWLPKSITTITGDDLCTFSGGYKSLTIYYSGTEAEYAAIDFANGEFNLTQNNMNTSNCTVHYNADFAAMLEAENAD